MLFLLHLITSSRISELSEILFIRNRGSTVLNIELMYTFCVFNLFTERREVIVGSFQASVPSGASSSALECDACLVSCVSCRSVRVRNVFCRTVCSFRMLMETMRHGKNSPKVLNKNPTKAIPYKRTNVQNIGKISTVQCWAERKYKNVIF
jgi:hypothetical protein